MLVVPVGVGLQKAAGDEVADETPLFQIIGLGARGALGIGKLQQQRGDLRAGDFSVRQCGGDRFDASALGPEVERDAIELGELAAEIALGALCPPAVRVARQQRDVADPQPAGVALDASRAQPEAARER
jgi:hypothetical protein